ncbi:MAG: 3-deoxy-7-phosphoheptulonate synthase class II [Bryobacteraceae bacterium]|nr:3-deoxy-7-phosphoheptulonate synthase class II [Bryobacteraceae bacterium]
MDWSPSSWQAKPALQQPVYDDPAELSRIVAELAHLPPLVTSWEVEALKAQLAEAAAGQRFVLQGGDCAERFQDCHAPTITNQLKILLQMSLVLIQGSRKRVTRIGRFAGQYAKPRTADTETRNGLTLPSYRGDLVNRPEFTPEARRPDPCLLLRGYERAALTLNFARSLAEGGFADLHHPEYWDLDFVQHSPLADEFHRMAETVREALVFMENVLGVRHHELEEVDFYTSHEGLHLHYEQAQTRRVPRRQGYYNLSCHLPWIGVRTADADGAHVEYFRGIRNPIAVKIGATTSPAHLCRLLEALDPCGEPGRLTLIHRFGVSKIAAALPPLIDVVQRSGKQVLWICDPMHGNTRTAGNGYKTRNFEEIEAELEHAFDIHAARGSYLGGMHIELTGDNVTECVGGARGLTEADLERAYKSEVDPRLNYEQALEIAMLAARRMSRTARSA